MMFPARNTKIEDSNGYWRKVGMTTWFYISLETIGEDEWGWPMYPPVLEWTEIDNGSNFVYTLPGTDVVLYCADADWHQRRQLWSWA